MKQEVAEAWASALRSGKYSQTQHVLHNSDGFCCLGVLCDISKLDKWKDSKLAKHGEAKKPLYYDDSGGALPLKVMLWAEMSSSTGRIGDNVAPSLASLNDQGFSFEEIANVIERNWEKL